MPEGAEAVLFTILSFKSGIIFKREDTVYVIRCTLQNGNAQSSLLKNKVLPCRIDLQLPNIPELYESLLRNGLMYRMYLVRENVKMTC